MKSLLLDIHSKWIACLTIALMVLFIHKSGTSQEINIPAETHNQDSIIVSYRETLGGTRESMDSTALTIFSDGYMQIHRPFFMKQSGIYGAYLNWESLDHLWHLLTAREILQFDTTIVHKKIQEEKQQQKTLLSSVNSISDAPTTIIEIYPNRYKSSAQEFEQGNLHAKKTISWRGLKWTAEQFPSLEEIRPLITIQHEFEKIMDRSDFEKIK